MLAHDGFVCFYDNTMNRRGKFFIRPFYWMPRTCGRIWNPPLRVHKIDFAYFSVPSSTCWQYHGFSAWNTRPAITYTDLYEWGISGTPDSADRRRALLARLGLPPRLSKKELLQVLNTLYTRESLQAQIEMME